MHFLLLLLELLIERLFPGSQDGLKVAARSDGRVEQLPADSWDRWRRIWCQVVCDSGDGKRKVPPAGDAARPKRAARR